ncbi:MAG: xanthine dehydrogenase accessory protein XdhC [Elusimicrobia bacterium]|nr:xanthine dehydrogenase accessory protein XdhC [Elusimicrobiota bacterium]
MEPLSAADLAGDLPRPATLCTLAEVTGSAPQAPGAKMWVWADGTLGTLGGGRFEAEVIAEARRRLDGGSAGLKEYVLCREMGQCCGGKAKVLFEPCPRRRAVHVFGAGHVGRALAATLDGLDLDVLVYDPRPDWAERSAFPAKTRLVPGDPRTVAAAAGYGPHDAACVLTHDHELDFALVGLLLDKPLGFLGLIGSEHKARVFRARLPEAVRPLWDRRVRCPIGRRVPSKSPKAVAIAIAASLIEDWAFRRAPSPETDVPAPAA